MRIVLIRPCCIGDAVMATAALTALRDAYPNAHITWAVGGWSRRAVEYHPAVDAILDTGNAAMPVKSIAGFMRFVRQLRQGDFDIAVSLVRSPLMSAAVMLSGIPIRAGLNSNGRGFGYNRRAKTSPNDNRSEAEIFLDVVATLNTHQRDYRINLPVLAGAREQLAAIREGRGIANPYIVIHPGGGSNPGMVMSSKRWLPNNFAQVADALAAEYNATIILIGAENDTPILQAVQQHMQSSAHVFAGLLSFPQVGALAADALCYIGNDTGLTHLAAASGAKTIMILGPSDPTRYAPYSDNSLALWKPTTLKSGGVAGADTSAWDWARDGISVDAALPQILGFLSAESP